MADTRITIVIPTIGRPALAATLRSIAGAGIIPGDEVIVVSDGPEAHARALPVVDAEPARTTVMNLRLEEGPYTHHFGAAQRNLGMDLAAGDLLMFIDDDDRYMPGILADVRNTVAKFPDRMLLYRHDYGNGVIWRNREIRLGNLGTSMLVVPRRLIAPVRWTLGPGVDYRFIRDLAAKGVPVEWIDRKIIYRLLPGKGRMDNAS